MRERAEVERPPARRRRLPLRGRQQDQHAERNHSTVAASPSSSPVAGRQPSTRLGQPGAGDVALDLAAARRAVLDRHARAGRGEHEPRELADRRLPPGGEVHGAPGVRRVERGQDPGADVVDVEEVARRAPVAVEHERLAAQRAGDEPRHGTALVRRARAVDVREAQRDRRQPVGAAEGVAVALAGQLARAVRADRPRHARLVDGRRRVADQRSAGRREDEAAGAGVLRALQHGQGPARVDVEVRGGVGDRLDHVAGRGEVDHRVGAGRSPGDGVRIADVARDQLGAVRQRVGRAVRQVVEHPHIGATAPAGAARDSRR